MRLKFFGQNVRPTRAKVHDDLRRVKVRDVEAPEDDSENWELVHTFPPGYAAEFGEDGSLHIFKRVGEDRTHVEDHMAKTTLLRQRIAAINAKHDEYYRRTK